MKRSTERILTTHTGSLPRPEELVSVLERRDRGELAAGDLPALDRQVGAAVADVVQRQAAAGLDVVNDGEASKIGYATYVKERLTGFEGDVGRPGAGPADLLDFPGFGRRRAGGRAPFVRPACTGDVCYRDLSAVEKDIANLRSALEPVHVDEAFMSAVSPGVIAWFIPNQHYPSDEDYLGALVEAMKHEYDAIHRAGFVLQVDCPDLAGARHIWFAERSLAEFRRDAELHVEALNHALRDIPPEDIRLHLCWGNYEGPHHHDVPLRDIIDIVFKARVSAISFEAANPRHAHEWRVFEDVRLPEGTALIPGVLDSTTNYIEHPELVAERLIRFAGVIGREQLIAGTDCGFATFATLLSVDPAIAWAKLAALAEGARLATHELY